MNLRKQMLSKHYMLIMWPILFLCWGFGACTFGSDFLLYQENFYTKLMISLMLSFIRKQNLGILNLYLDQKFDELKENGNKKV